jgi:hypothetical protein
MGGLLSFLAIMAGFMSKVAGHIPETTACFQVLIHTGRLRQLKPLCDENAVLSHPKCSSLILGYANWPSEASMHRSNPP